MSVVIPFPGITIHFPFFLDAPSDDFLARKSRIRYRFVTHARGKCCPFLFLRAIRRPNVFGHSIDAVFQRELPHEDRHLTQNCFRVLGGIFCKKKTGEMLPFLPPFDVNFFFEKLRNLLGRILKGEFLVKNLRETFLVEEFLWENFW